MGAAGSRFLLHPLFGFWLKRRPCGLDVEVDAGLLQGFAEDVHVTLIVAGNEVGASLIEGIDFLLGGLGEIAGLAQIADGAFELAIEFLEDLHGAGALGVLLGFELLFEGGLDARFADLFEVGDELVDAFSAELFRGLVISHGSSGSLVWFNGGQSLLTFLSNYSTNILVKLHGGG